MLPAHSQNEASSRKGKGSGHFRKLCLRSSVADDRRSMGPCQTASNLFVCCREQQDARLGTYASQAAVSSGSTEIYADQKEAQTRGKRKMVLGIHVNNGRIS